MVDIIYLYKLVTPNVLYIGITNNPTRRYKEHLTASSNSILAKSIKESGKDTIIFTILAKGHKEYILDLEIKYIALCRKIESNLTVANISDGGDVYKIGDLNANTKISDNNVLLIRELYDANRVTIKELAALYNVVPRTITQILSGKTRCHIGGPIQYNLSINSGKNKRIYTPEFIYKLRVYTYNMHISGINININSLSNLYGINRSTLYNILLGISYTECKGPLLGKEYLGDKYGRSKS